MRIVYTDGSGNVGPGGWAWVEMTEDDGWVRAAFGYDAETTNQRMELRAVLEVLLEFHDEAVLVVSDSAYVTNCFLDRWFDKWRRNGWRTGKKKPVENQDLWRPAVHHYLRREHPMEFLHVAGHSGDKGNDMADRLCGAARRERRSGHLGPEALSMISGSRSLLLAEVGSSHVR